MCSASHRLLHLGFLIVQALTRFNWYEDGSGETRQERLKLGHLDLQLPCTVLRAIITKL